ncbi:zinc finger MYM-type protein 2-like, partial [Lethenteron reissneri]|uniref:zinc finger MYM-type protein 2-like n=1 Tax=Lethenteron reissneri TaxID=7753 RepID=UPI002AB60826
MMFQFCSWSCCDEYKRSALVLAVCDFCKNGKLLHEQAAYLGETRSFCTDLCRMFYEQELTNRLGKMATTCAHCRQLCRQLSFRDVSRQAAATPRDFCSQACQVAFMMVHYKLYPCDACGKKSTPLTVSLPWAADMRHFCDHECMVIFCASTRSKKAPHRRINPGENAPSEWPASDKAMKNVPDVGTMVPCDLPLTTPKTCSRGVQVCK